MEWLTACLWQAVLTGIPPNVPWNAAVPVAELTGESWTDHDPDIVRLVYAVLVEQSTCGKCDAPLRPVFSARIVVGPCTPPRFVVTARCRSWRRHRHVAQVTHRRGGLCFEELHPA
jgi:hypothetical protein